MQLGDQKPRIVCCAAFLFVWNRCISPKRRRALLRDVDPLGALQKGCLPSGLGLLVFLMVPSRASFVVLLFCLSGIDGIRLSVGALVFVMLTLWGLYKKDVFLRV
jgi:hypothetical protein